MDQPPSQIQTLAITRVTIVGHSHGALPSMTNPAISVKKEFDRN
jgi:hypothetical protein